MLLLMLFVLLLLMLFVLLLLMLLLMLIMIIAYVDVYPGVNKLHGVI